MAEDTANAGDLHLSQVVHGYRELRGQRGVDARGTKAGHQTSVPKVALAPPPCQATSSRRQVQTLCGSGERKLGHWWPSRLALRGALVAVQDIKRSGRANHCVQNETSAADASEPATRTG